MFKLRHFASSLILSPEVQTEIAQEAISTYFLTGHHEVLSIMAQVVVISRKKAHRERELKARGRIGWEKTGEGRKGEGRREKVRQLGEDTCKLFLLGVTCALAPGSWQSTAL